MDVYARRRLVAVLAIVLVLVLIGVAVAGGGDDEPETPITTVTGASTPGLATPLSKDEFVQQADDICEETAVGIENISSDDSEQIAAEELALTESQLDQLRSLAPPEEDQTTLDDFFSALEDLVDALDTRALALERGDDSAAAEAETEISTAETELADAANAYGFKECGTTAEAASGADGTGGAGAPTDTGAVPVTPTTPPATTPPATTPPATPPADDGSGDDGSGGVSPGSGGVSP
jgi:hypothetical protein